MLELEDDWEGQLWFGFGWSCVNEKRRGVFLLLRPFFLDLVVEKGKLRLHLRRAA